MYYFISLRPILTERMSYEKNAFEEDECIQTEIS